jgi:hypothetical protein
LTLIESSFRDIRMVQSGHGMSAYTAKGIASMNGPANRLFRSKWIVLALSCVATGCQSVTQQKFAWSFPPIPDDAEARPLVASEDGSLPPLPTNFARSDPQATSPFGKYPEAAGAGEAVATYSGANAPKYDPSLVRTSAVIASNDGTSPAPVASLPTLAQTPDLPEQRTNQPGIEPAKPIFSLKEGVASKPLDQPASESVPPPPVEPVRNALVALDPRTTRQVVKNIVGATDDLIRTGTETSDDDPLEIPGANIRHIRDLRSGTVGSPIPVDEALSKRIGKSRSEPVRPPIEVLADELPRSTKASQVPQLVIPKAAICKSVDGRGRFSALPAQMRSPGSTVLIYWEMDGLTRDTTSRSAAFTAVVELMSPDGDEILASVRENVRDASPAPAEGDFAALRWQIPAEIDPGDYRIRINVTEESTKKTATNQIELSLDRGPVASRLILP